MRLFAFLIFFALFTGLTPAVNAKSKKHRTAKTSSRVVVKKAKRSKKVRQVETSPKVYVPAGIIGQYQLSNSLNYLVNTNPPNADIAVVVKSMRSGDILYSRNVNEQLTPASTLKVLTAEAGLIFLGPEYRFSTQLLTDAKTIRNGVLEGNLYLVLNGDPSLTYDDLVKLMASLTQHQINAIAGNVYIDNTAYDQDFYGPGWIEKDKGFCYAAPISASIINHNCLNFKLIPGRSSQLASNTSKHYSAAIRSGVVSKPPVVRSCLIRLGKGNNSNLIVDGCMRAGRYAWGVSSVVTNIPEYNRILVKSLLSKVGINNYGSIAFVSAPDKISLIDTHNSEPLKKLIHDMLKKSDNVIAGALFKKIGQLYTRRPGSWENGAFAVSQILSRRAGVNTSGLRILDGSGLSPNNLTTPSQMLQVLDFAYHAPTSYEFISSLPVAGIDGTLKHRMGNIARKVRAKTGTISGVVSLAGYAVSAEKEPLAFVIMINGNKGMGWRYKATEDKIATALTRFRRGSY